MSVTHTTSIKTMRWQPIETAPKDGRVIIGAFLDRHGQPWRISEMRHNGLAFYTLWQGSMLSAMTHWIPLPVSPEVKV